MTPKIEITFNGNSVEELLEGVAVWHAILKKTIEPKQQDPSPIADTAPEAGPVLPQETPAPETAPKPEPRLIAALRELADLHGGEFVTALIMQAAGVPKVSQASQEGLTALRNTLRASGYYND